MRQSRLRFLLFSTFLVSTAACNFAADSPEETTAPTTPVTTAVPSPPTAVTAVPSPPTAVGAPAEVAPQTPAPQDPVAAGEQSAPVPGETPANGSPAPSLEPSPAEPTVPPAPTPSLTPPIPEQPAPMPEPVTPRAPLSDRIGLQLFTFRNQLDGDLPGTLTQVQQMGFRRVEAYSLHGQTAAQLRQLMDERGLEVGGFSASFERLASDPAGVIADAQTLGAPVVSCAWIPHQGGYTALDNQRAINVFSNVGTLAQAAGMRFVYHPHGYEFHPGGIGETLFDQMLQQTTPGVVDFELDTFWMVHGGADPVAYLERYPDRFPLFHLKDMREGTPVGLTTGQASGEANVQLGTGIIDIAAIIATAEKQSEPAYFIEDESSVALRNVPLSLQFLLNLEQ